MQKKKETKKNREIKINFDELPERSRYSNNETTEKILKRVTGQINDPCIRNCDCSFGLICSKGVCTEDW